MLIESVAALSVSLVGNSSHEPGKRTEVPRDQVLGLLRQKPLPLPAGQGRGR
jgi:hypothetical protein